MMRKAGFFQQELNHEMNRDLNPDQTLTQWADEIFSSSYQSLAKDMDRIFGFLMVAQWIFGIFLALVITPKTGLGTQSQTNTHLWMAVMGGGFLAILPVLLILMKPGAGINRYVNVISQALFSALFIHLTGGRIETHFHVFGSLAFFAFYLEVPVLITGTLVIVIDHFLRGMWYPESLFGVADPTRLRWLESTAWMIFEVFFLVLSCFRFRRQMKASAFEKAEIQQQQFHIEKLAEERLGELERARSSNQLIMAHIENTSTALNQIMGMVEANVKSAENVNSVAGEVHGVSESTRHVMEELTLAMQNILESNGRIETLVKIIEQIAEKTEVIDDIVFKTQLLSFNASVEAERAGEHGRGFAVVAQEVGNLAQMSGKAATEIAAIVKNSIREADQVAGENRARVEKGGDLVSQTRDKTSGVLNRITEILNATDQILSASKDQSRELSDISKSIETLHRQTQNQDSLGLNSMEDDDAIVPFHRLKIKSQ